MFLRKTGLDKARALWAKGAHGEAIQTLAAALAQDGDSTAAMTQLAGWQLIEGQHDAAGKLLFRLARFLKLDADQVVLAPDDDRLLKELLDGLHPQDAGRDTLARFLALLAFYADRESGTKAAGRLYRNAFQRDPQYVTAAVGLAQSLLTLEAHDKCLELVEMWVENFPDSTDLYRIGALAAVAVGDHELANDYRHGWLVLDPTRDELLAVVGPWLYDRREIPACLELYTAALERHRDDPNLLNLLGNLHLEHSTTEHELSHLRQASALLEASLAINPDQPQVQQLLAKATARLGAIAPAEEEATPADAVAAAAVAAGAVGEGSDSDPLASMGLKGLFEDQGGARAPALS